MKILHDELKIDSLHSSSYVSISTRSNFAKENIIFSECEKFSQFFPLDNFTFHIKKKKKTWDSSKKSSRTFSSLIYDLTTLFKLLACSLHHISRLSLIRTMHILLFFVKYYTSGVLSERERSPWRDSIHLSMTRRISFISVEKLKDYEIPFFLSWLKM